MLSDVSSSGAVSKKTGNRYPTERMPGAVCKQYRIRGSKMYGPYYFRFWRERGRLRKEYVPRAEVEAVRAACEAHRARRKAVAWMIASSKSELANFKALVTAAELVWTGGNEQQLSDSTKRRLRGMGLPI